MAGGHMYRTKSALFLLALAILSGCGPTVRQTTVIGSPGPVYRTADRGYVVNILNNMRNTLDVEVGRTIVATIPPGATETVNLCSRLVIGPISITTQSGRTSSYVMRVKARTDSTYIGATSKTFSVNCTRHREIDWTIRNVTVAR
jgi:hypothetical protein